jgi:transposase-like protein
MVVEYPKNRRDFDAMFATEEACVKYLGALRWANGFQCRQCGSDKAWTLSRHIWECANCGTQRSPTEGTLLHRTRHPLRTWFDAAWRVCEQKNGISAVGLQRAMGLGSYHTAWEWMHRMRQAMVLPGRSKLTGEVEIDEAFIGGVKSGKRGRGALGKVMVMVAVEVRGTAIGRARLQVIPDAKADTLLETVQSLAEPGSEIVTDGLASYGGLPALGFNHTVSRHTPEVGNNLLPKAHRVIALVKRWLLGTHQGSFAHDRLQTYLDEFVFRFNRRTSNSRGLLFHRLLSQCLQHSPIPSKLV